MKLNFITFTDIFSKKSNQPVCFAQTPPPYHSDLGSHQLLSGILQLSPLTLILVQSFLTKTHVAFCDLTPATLQPVLSLFLLCCSCSGHMTFISNWPFHHRGFCPCCSLHLLLSLCLVNITSSFRTLFQVTFFSLP